MDLIVTSCRLEILTLPAADLKLMPSGASMCKDLVKEANRRSFLGGARRLSVSTEPLKWAPFGPKASKEYLCYKIVNMPTFFLNFFGRSNMCRGESTHLSSLRLMSHSCTWHHKQIKFVVGDLLTYRLPPHSFSFPPSTKPNHQKSSNTLETIMKEPGPKNPITKFQFIYHFFYYLF